jgi:hypothetical protein
LLFEKLKAYLVAKNAERPPSKNITLSNLGACRRQLGYKYHGFPALPADSDRVFVFDDGTNLHESIRQLMLKAGIQLEDQEKRVEAKLLPEYSVRGQIDGIVVLDGHKYLFELKSASSGSFWKMLKGDLGLRYTAQIQASLEATGLTSCVVLLKNKENGQFGEVAVYKDDDIIQNLRERLKTVITSTPDNLPAPDFGPNEDGEYPYECIGCSYRNHCVGKIDLKAPSYKKKSKT